MEAIKESEWYKTRPDVIKKAIDRCPPDKPYSLNGRQCYIYSYEEPESGKLKDVTVTVQKTGSGSPFPSLNTNKVFGVKLNDLKIWNEPKLN